LLVYLNQQAKEVSIELNNYFYSLHLVRKFKKNKHHVHRRYVKTFKYSYYINKFNSYKELNDYRNRLLDKLYLLNYDIYNLINYLNECKTNLIGMINNLLYLEILKNK